uniref:BHLH domain-containing protein n=1 Tax=Leersia perrieri TaxID=77586 RepID=A0A0D9UVT6_9ORYZ
MASSSSSSSLCDHLSLQDDLPWPSMPFAPALHAPIGVNHQWSHQQPLMLDQFSSSYELEPAVSVQNHLASASTLSPLQAQLSTVLMMQELGFQWSSCALAAADHHTTATSMNNVMEEEQLRNPRSSSSCGTATTYTDMLPPAPPTMAANLDGNVLPSINVSRLQKTAAGGDSPLPQTMLAASISCKSQAASSAAASVVGHMSYGPPAHLIHGPSIDDIHSLQIMKRNTQRRGDRNGDATKQRSAVAPSPSSKKPRLESRSSSAILPSFKVRKEKLGDRIAALQQLVSPFGKTDTASVLMEAIGYIKFLQDQVETLSGPYLKSSKNSKKACRAAQQRKGASNGGAEAASKLDLRSRGLCLVPLSCTSYVTNENGVWPPPNFRGN